MRQIDIKDSTFNELAKLTTPLKGETADTVISNLLRRARRNGHAPGAPAKTAREFISRKVNPDKLSKLVRKRYRDENGVPMKYWEAAQKVFNNCRKRKLSLLIITRAIFDFPNNAKKEDRTERAARSLSVALRGYTGGPARRTFHEPEVDVFQLKRKK